MKKNKNEKPDEKSLVVPETPSYPVLQGDPERQIEYGRKAAKALMRIVSQKPKKVIIGGKQYVEYEDWQTVARFYGATAEIEWTRVIVREEDKDKPSAFRTYGYEARAVVKINGQQVSAAEAMCTRDEPNWSNRPEFMLRSMSQTRAAAKSLRNVFAWVVVMAGFAPTPAEEMEGIADIEAAKTEERKTAKDTSKALKIQKMAIVNLLYQASGVKPTDGLAVIRAKVKELTDCDLVPKEYGEIISRLQILVSEKRTTNA